MPHKQRVMDTLQDYILVFGTEDWVDVRIVADAIASELDLRDRPELVRELSVKLISDLIRSDYFVAGELCTAGFEAWRIDTEETIDHIEDRWLALGDKLPGINEVAWLDLTEHGERRAAKVNREALDTLGIQQVEETR